jgi:pyrroloquinoline quinone (PQQ) biosynthesis protein C
MTGHWDVAQHPFYQRWSAGGLTSKELAFYAGQHHHVLTTTARLAEAAACLAPDVALWDELEMHAANARRRIETWRRFSTAMGNETTVAATRHTHDCLRVWAPCREGPLPRTLTAIYVIQVAEPRLAALKKCALTTHYDIDQPGVLDHFNGHVRLATDHAEHSRAVITPYLVPEIEERLIAEAERVLRARWELLDGLQDRA